MLKFFKQLFCGILKEHYYAYYYNTYTEEGFGECVDCGKVIEYDE